MALRLYELNEATSALEDKILETAGNTEEEPLALITLLEDLKIEQGEKIVELGSLYKNLQAEAEGLKFEKKRLNDRLMALNKQMEGVKGAILAGLDAKGEKQVVRVDEEGRVRCKVRWQKNPVSSDSTEDLVGETTGALEVNVNGVVVGCSIEKVNMEVSKEMAPEFWRVYVKVEPARKKITDYWRATGRTPNGTVIKDNERSVRIQ